MFQISNVHRLKVNIRLKMLSVKKKIYQLDFRGKSILDIDQLRREQDILRE